ncbi:MAG TPA: hypothetical protein PKC91_05485 [Ignavibacteria bacterium]|nr:hypothetical protein [Ignavibacteria bacterium]
MKLLKTLFIIILSEGRNPTTSNQAYFYILHFTALIHSFRKTKFVTSISKYYSS